jgi:hypothetical protein
MPTASSKRLTFKEQPVASSLFLLCWVNFFVSFFLQSRWSPLRVSAPDDLHTVPIHWRGGVDYFYSPIVAFYIDISVMAPFVVFIVAMLGGWLLGLLRRVAR